MKYILSFGLDILGGRYIDAMITFFIQEILLSIERFEAARPSQLINIMSVDIDLNRFLSKMPQSEVSPIDQFCIDQLRVLARINWGDITQSGR